MGASWPHLKLEKVPMELLILLAEREGQLVTREEIVQRLWGSDVFVDTRQGINTAVRKIRQALSDDPDNPRILQTVFGKGYRLLGEVTRAESDAPRVSTRSGPHTALEPPAIAGPALQPAADPTRVSSRPPIRGSAVAGKLLPVPGRGPIDPKLARSLFLLIQSGYLLLYAAAFVLFPNIIRLSLPPFVPTLLLVMGLIGGPVRLYLIAAVGFNYWGYARLFRQAFPGILVLDTFWAASPLLLFGQLGYLTLLFVAALAFLPFSQRTLVACAQGGSLAPFSQRGKTST